MAAGVSLIGSDSSKRDRSPERAQPDGIGKGRFEKEDLYRYALESEIGGAFVAKQVFPSSLFGNW